MDINEVYHFLFETMPGIGCLVGAVLIISIIVSVVLEWRTKRMFKSQETDGRDEWLDEEEDEDE